MNVFECTLLSPTGFEIIEVSTPDELIDKLKDRTGGSNFILKHVPSCAMSMIKNNNSNGDQLLKLLDELRKTECGIVGYAGDYSSKDSEKDIRISSEKSNLIGTFCVSEDNSCIIFDPLRRFDKERDSYKYYGRFDYYTDMSMQEIINPIMNKARIFKKYDTRGNIETISKSEMEMIINRFIGREIDDGEER